MGLCKYILIFGCLQFSLPLPQGGRDAITKNLILREDQLPQKFLYPKTKKKTNKPVNILSLLASLKSFCFSRLLEICFTGFLLAKYLKFLLLLLRPLAYFYFQGDEFFTTDNVFTHHTDKKAPLQPPIRKALSVFSGRRNPNDNHFSRSKHK